MNCDMCGRQPQQYKVSVEGSTMLLCQACAKFGKVLGRATQPAPEKVKAIEKPEIFEVIVAELPKLIRQKREALKENHEEFAARLGIKTSILHKIEAGNFTPEMEIAKRFEKILGLKLITVEDTKTEAPVFKQAEGMTLGDFIKIKKL